MEDMAPLTVGVEEEFLLVDVDTATAAARVDEIEAALDQDLRPRMRREFHASQLELATEVHTDLTGLLDQISTLRRAAATAAATIGCRLLAVGTAVYDGPPPPVTDDPRYTLMAERFGAVADTPGLCGCHVHVGVPDRERAVQVCNHLRPWLPTLLAMTANSPFSDGRDTGYASWRSVLWAHWPSAGPPPYFQDLQEYETTVARMISTGAMLDEGMVYWYARPSIRYPTVEVRVGDVCATADDTVLVAALIRGLVGTALEAIRAGRAASRVPDGLLSAALWRAGHDGLEGDGVDAVTGAVAPGWELVDRLVRHVEPALDRHGDLATVHDLLDLLRRRGTGAARQRKARADGGLHEVLALLAKQTAGDRPRREASRMVSG
jgi:glutamate---cysteine ligase / carboxylate-amine ligase